MYGGEGEGVASIHLDTQKEDPNFPKGGLKITPSFDRYNVKEENEWAKDSKEDIEQFGIAGRIWEASYLMQRYLTFDSFNEVFDPSCLNVIASKDDHHSCTTILELGAGVGLVGIHLAQQFQQHYPNHRTQIILTDLHNVLPLLTRNAIKAGVFDPNNNISNNNNNKQNDLIKIEALPWGSESEARSILDHLRSRNRSITHILCSDLVYFPELLSPLLRTLLQLTTTDQSTTTTKVIISYKIRSLPKEEPFWRSFGAWFDFAPVLISQSNQSDFGRRFGTKKSDMYPFNQAPIHLQDQDAGDDVFIFVATRRPETLSCEPVSDDGKLMEGFMRSKDGKEVQGKGIDEFELILMASLEG